MTWPRWEKQSTLPPAIFLAVINLSNICLRKFFFVVNAGYTFKLDGKNLI